MDRPADRAAGPSIVSPCVAQCRIDPANALCTGCGRTLDEIVRWSTGTDTWRAEVMAGLAKRLSDAGEGNPRAL
ncbi:DUF1289 domain-containing protein [Sphingomonas sp. PAMC 26617]|uniref:DUF1289 domain-containing protein n=1 Tax=Sphingomonas sp. PAMC 26617 TaxID=1112216 RepID=UPI0006882C95|nr:DUF1289 domain-containing protein [Sphingomonas sp. PAMC 26617]